MISHACPECGHELRSPDGLATLMQACPFCKVEVQVPSAPLGRRLTAHRTPWGGPAYKIAGKPPAEIKVFFQSIGLNPPISEADMDTLCEAISTASDQKGRTLRGWEQFLYSSYTLDNQSSGKRRRMGGPGNEGRDGYINI
jgi:hypothetical protein